MEGQAPLLDRELLVVTGKGGVGKTTVAAALALACARTGRRVIVCEVSGQAGISRLFDGTGDAYRRDQVVVIEGDRIKEVGPVSSATRLLGAKVLISAARLSCPV